MKGAVAVVVSLAVVPSLALGAPASSSCEKRVSEVLQQARLWVDRAHSLAGATKSKNFDIYRSQCWSVGVIPQHLKERLTDNAGRLKDLASRLTQGVAQDTDCGQLDSIRTEFDVLQRKQAALEMEVLSPLPMSPSLAWEVLGEKPPQRADERVALDWGNPVRVDGGGVVPVDKPVGEKLKTRTAACEKMVEEWETGLMRYATYRPELAWQPKVVNERVREYALTMAVLRGTAAGGAAGLPGVMTESTGVAEQIGGTEALALSLLSAHGVDARTVGPQAQITLRLPLYTPATPSVAPRDYWAVGLLRVQVPLSATAPEHLGLSAPKNRRDTLRYSGTVGVDFPLTSDPRHSNHQPCLRAVEALEPLPGQLKPASVETATRRRAELYARCVERARQGWRGGLRGSVQWVQRSGQQESAAGELALGSLGLLVGNEYLTAQAVYRRVAGITWSPRPYAESATLALGLGTGVGQLGVGGAQWLRLGVDGTLTTAWSGGRLEQGSIEALIAPSLLVRLGGNVSVVVSSGYLASPTRPGLLFNLGMNIDADWILSDPPPPPSP